MIHITPPGDWNINPLKHIDSIIALALFWWNTRQRSIRQHSANQTRLSVIECQLEPIVKWFNEVRTNGGKPHG